MRSRDADALRLAAGEPARAAVAVGGGIEADHLQQLVDALCDLVARPAEQRRNDGDVLRDGHVREQADGLNHVADAAPQLDGVELSRRRRRRS